MLLKLKVKNDFLKVSINKFSLILHSHQMNNFFPRKSLSWVLFYIILCQESVYLLIGDWFQIRLILNSIGFHLLRLLVSKHNLLREFLFQNVGILWVVHFFNYLSPHPFFDYTSLYSFKEFIYFCFNFERISIFHQNF